MELFRISSAKYANKLNSSGASNRWNKKGEYVIYSGSSISLSTLELIVHKNFIKPEIKFEVMIISVPDHDRLVTTVSTKDLPDNWRKFAVYSALQNLGSEWYNHRTSLLLKVPSSIIPFEYNYIINTEHKDFSKSVQLIRKEPYFWDDRLLQ